MSGKIPLDLGDIQTTLLLPLWGRAVETRKKNPLLTDITAAEIVDKLDYDFSTIAQNTHQLSQMAWIIRSRQMDDVIGKFLEKHPRASIVNVGCGLDTTFDRIDNGTLRWYDLDLPDVIALRRKFIRETDRRKFVTSSFLDKDWLNGLPADQGIFFMAAGVLYYFEEEKVKEFFGRIAGTFPGSEIIFDAASPFGVRVANKIVIKSSGLDERSFLKWGLKNVHDLEAWDIRIKIIKVYPFFRKMKKGLSLKMKYAAFISDLLRIQYMVHVRFLSRENAIN